jgi:large subunit ribosomal protein L18
MSISINQRLSGRDRRKVRVRKRIFGTDVRPRLSVFRSAKHIYAQVIDDTTGQTLACAGTLGKSATTAEGDKRAQAAAVGKAIAEACAAKQIESVVFDRNGYRYQGRGRLQALAEAARAGGLKF